MARHSYDSDPSANELADVLDGIVLHDTRRHLRRDYSARSTTTIGGTEYTLTEAYSFWGEFTKMTRHRAEFTDADKPLADADG